MHTRTRERLSAAPMATPAPTSRKGGKAAAAKPPPPTAPNADMETAGKVLRQFRVVFNAVKTHLQQVEKAVGIGGAQVWALGIIATRQGVGVNELARAMDIHQSTASNLVKTLVSRDLAVASKDGADRRAVQLRITPAGKRLLRNAPVPLAGGLPQALAQLDPATLTRLEHDLSLLISALDTGAPEAGAGGDVGPSKSVRAASAPSD